MKIVLCGACGRMGRAVTELATARGEQIVYGVDIDPAPMPYPVGKDLSDAPKADICIDFSSPNGLAERLAWCREHKIPAVLGTTGFSEADLAVIERFAEQIPLFRSSNLSLGINLLQKLAKTAAEVLGDGFDVEIVERHHNRKKDAPSGTALMLAECVNAGLGGGYETVCGRGGLVGERRTKEIGIHAVRGGTVVGEHEIMFAGEDEIITISHSARSRTVFASGALRAAHWLLTRPVGLYDMDDFLADIVACRQPEST